MNKRKLISLMGVVGLVMAALCSVSAQEYKAGPSEKDFAGYLFTYFKGNAIADEAVCFAISTDGYTFRALNNNQPILDSKRISSTGGVRDPHILRAEDGKSFYMVLTDMTASKGWDSNRAMV
ncbi:MAG: glycoside hydrolase, partial [Sphingobacterium paramultivorum]